MQRLDYTYILTGLIWLVFGMGFGIWLGISEQFNFANSHAHANLVGFTISTLFGLIHAAFPTLRGSRIAGWQFIVYEVGAVMLVAGKMQADVGGDLTLVKIGSVVTVAGTLMMLWLFAMRGRDRG